jgi:hypothetical protein
MSKNIQANHVKPGHTPIYKSNDGIYLTATKMDPTWIQLPPELGGQKVNVEEVFMAKVCQCGQHPAKVFILEGDYLVTECTIKGWTWCKKPPNLEQFKRNLAM